MDNTCITSKKSENSKRLWCLRFFSSENLTCNKKKSLSKVKYFIISFLLTLFEKCLPRTGCIKLVTRWVREKVKIKK